jgi:hypothetical protein
MAMRSEQDKAKHLSLVEELVECLTSEGFTISSADGVPGYSPPLELPNDGYGDQEDKAPDVYAYDPKDQRTIIGEAKTGAGDLETEHALTQYNVFLDQLHRRTSRRATLYIIVPAAIVAEFNTLITHYLHPDLWPNIVVVQSRRWEC